MGKVWSSRCCWTKTSTSPGQHSQDVGSCSPVVPGRSQVPCLRERKEGQVSPGCLTCVAKEGSSISVSDESLVSELSAGFVVLATFPDLALVCCAVFFAGDAFTAFPLDGTAVAGTLFVGVVSTCLLSAAGFTYNNGKVKIGARQLRAGKFSRNMSLIRIQYMATVLQAPKLQVALDSQAVLESGIGPWFGRQDPEFRANQLSTSHSGEKRPLRFEMGTLN